MKYLAKLLYQNLVVVGESETEDAAIQLALNSSITLRDAHKSHVALVMFHVFSNANHVSYATTLSKYEEACS